MRYFSTNHGKYYLIKHKLRSNFTNPNMLMLLPILGKTTEEIFYNKKIMFSPLKYISINDFTTNLLKQS